MPGSLPEILLSGDCGSTVWSEECNCPSPGFRETGQTVDGFKSQSTFVQQAVYQRDLDTTEYKLLFSPMNGREVAVLNQNAYRLWMQFQMPVVLTQLGEKELYTSRQMIRAGLLEPLGGKVEPCQMETEGLNVWLHLTNACNLRCSYCYVQKSTEHMTLDTGRAAVDAAFRSAHLNSYHKIFLKYSGGEPLLQLNLVYQLHTYALQKADREGIELDGVILSNGTLLNEAVAAGIRAHGLRLMLSVDGIDEHHDHQRPFADGSGTFKRVWKAVNVAVNGGLMPFISVTVTGRSATGLPDLVERLLQIGLPFNLNFARPMTKRESVDTTGMIIGLQETLRRIEANLPAFSLTGSLLDRSFFSHPHERPCSVGEGYLAIDHAGRVARCQMTLRDYICDVHVEDPLAMLRLTETWKNPSVDHKDGCLACQWRYICAGGCPQAAYHTSGRYDAPSPFCTVYKALFPEILRLEGLRMLIYNKTQV